MEEFIFSYTVSVTLALSVIILAFLVFSKTIDCRFTAKFQYWVWLILSLRLVLPINILRSKPLVNIQTPYHWLPPEAAEQISGTPWLELQMGSLPNISLLNILTALWGMGMLAYFAFFLVQYHWFEYNLRRWSTPLKTAEAREVFQKAWKNSGIQKRLKVRVCPLAVSPMVVGFSSSTIVLPRENYSPQQLSMIFAHELVHCRRNDVLYQFLLLLVRGIHWFNPLVHIMVKQARKDMELSCDSEVVENCDTCFRRRYAEAILAVAKKECEIAAARPVLAAEFSASAALLKKRFLNLFDFRPKQNGAVLLLGLVAVSVISSSLCAFRGNDRNTQWAQDVTAAEIKEVIYYRDGQRKAMSRRQIQGMTNWLNEMQMEGTPLVRIAEKKMEQEKYQVTTWDNQVYQTVCKGEEYLSVNGKHYRRSQPSIFESAF